MAKLFNTRAKFNLRLLTLLFALSAIVPTTFGRPVFANTSAFPVPRAAPNTPTNPGTLPGASCQEMIANLNSFNALHNKEYMPDEATELKKIENMATWISAANNGKGALIQTFEEISDEVLQRIVQHDKIKNLGYQTHITSGKPDGRGIDVGLISRLPLIEEPIAHIYWQTNDPIWRGANGVANDQTGGALTRPILEAHLMLPNKEPVFVFVNHWASQLKEDWSVVRRYQGAQYLKKITDGILAKNPAANIVILGDFNTGPYGPEMKAGLQTAEMHQGQVANPEGPHLINLEDTILDLNHETSVYRKANPKATFHDIEEFQKELLVKEGTYYYAREKEWDAFDQIIVSSNMFKYFVSGSFTPIRNQGFVDETGKPIPFDPKTGEGMSDHLGAGAYFILVQ